MIQPDRTSGLDCASHRSTEATRANTSCDEGSGARRPDGSIHRAAWSIGSLMSRGTTAANVTTRSAKSRSAKQRLGGELRNELDDVVFDRVPCRVVLATHYLRDLSHAACAVAQLPDPTGHRVECEVLPALDVE